MKSLTFSKQTVTPDIARALLAETEKSGFVNRTATPSTVKKYAADMRKGHFFGDQTGETLKIAKIGKNRAVIDGQHRLHAIILADMAADLYVCEGVDVSMFKFIDGGKPRTLPDLMSIDGSPLSQYPSEFAVAGYMLYKEDKTGDPRTRPGADESDGTGTVLEYIKDFYATDLSALMTQYAPLFRKAQKHKIAPVSMLLYMAVRAARQDRDLLHKVLSYYGDFGGGAPCSKNLQFAAMKAKALYDEALADGDGKVMKARHKNLVDALLDAHLLGWNLTRQGLHLRGEANFNKKFNDQMELAWPGFQ